MASQDELLNLIKELAQMEHHEVAMELQEALIYLNCGHPEGFGLPLAETVPVDAWWWDTTD